jgi:hypothetical protein
MAIMSQEQQHDAKQREASRAGLFGGLILMLMAGLALIVGIYLWPLFRAIPDSPPAADVRE